MSRSTKTFEDICNFIRLQYDTDDFIPLHAPVFPENSKEYVNEAIDSTFVSSVGKFVERAEKEFAEKVGTKFAIATVNGTSALHVALKVAGVKQNEEVVTQPLTFVATCNAIRYLNAWPCFVDIDKETLGLSPEALRHFFQNDTELKNGRRVNKSTGRKVSACLPMHTFGIPVKLDEIKSVCDEFGVALIEDAAEAVGSKYRGCHVGQHGLLSAFSFNGNKIITSGGGGMITTNDEKLAKRAKHLTTVAKKNHPYKFYHDELGYNYRMPNLNAALLVAQLEHLDNFLAIKRKLNEKYEKFFYHIERVSFVQEPSDVLSNCWFNSILFDNEEERDSFLEYSNAKGIMTRPAWTPIYLLPEYNECFVHSSDTTQEISKRLVNIPSGINKI